MPETRPYGGWPSPITADLVSGAQAGLAFPDLDGGRLFFHESRPWEGGRTTLLMRAPGGRLVELTPAPFNLRTRVHEYGGRAYAVAGDVILAIEDSDQRVYRIREQAPPEPISPDEGGRVRYAELTIDRPRGRVIAVREDHRRQGEPRNDLVALDLEGRRPPEELASGQDFYAFPRLSPDGAALAWIGWNHPNMPWDTTRLWLARVDGDGRLGTPELIDGDDGVSRLQPEWGADGRLLFLSDRSGGWTVHDAARPAAPITDARGEIGGPLWQLGARWYAVIDEASLLVVVNDRGRRRLARLGLADGRLLPYDLPFVDTGEPGVEGGRAVLRAGFADRPGAIVAVDLLTGGFEAVRSAGTLELPPGWFAAPERLAFESAGGRTAYAFHYPPTNPEHEAPAGSRPPLIVRSHGGPTGAATPALRLTYQFWTSRGFAVVDVDYAGSTGYGRAYREALYGLWGVVDVEDCIAAARHLVETGRADPDRLIISGGSAGGFTTLSALTFHDRFCAGASYYGVGDLEALARDTHKFESRYLDNLVGPWPEAADLYQARSPRHHAEKLACPVIFFQGEADKVVPPNQTEAMVAALRMKGLPVACLMFPEEGHGFRKAENQKTALLAEYAFYCRVLGIEPAETLPPLEIENLT